MLVKRLSIFIIAVMMIIALTGCGSSTSSQDNNKEVKTETKSLQVYSGAGLRKPMDEIGKLFTEKFGVKVHYSYAGSAQNLSQIELSGKGDVYVPGSLYYYDLAKEKGLVDEKKDVAYHIPVIGVPRGNPANIKSLADLGKKDVRVALADEKSAAIGKLAQKLLEENNLKESVARNTVAKAATVNELVVYLTMKQADASIIWEDNALAAEEIEVIEIPKEKNMIKTIPVCVIKNSQQMELARQFVDFTASAAGKEIFQKHGFKPVE